MNLHLLREVAVDAWIVKAVSLSFTNYYSDICPLAEHCSLLAPPFFILKDFPIGWCWWIVVSTSYHNSQRGLLLPLHSSDWPGDV